MSIFKKIISLGLVFVLLIPLVANRITASSDDNQITRYEAEFASITGSYKTDSAFPDGTSNGAAVDWINDATLTFDGVYASNSQQYVLTIAYARGHNTSSIIPLTVNGKSSTLHLNSNGSWSSFARIQVSVQLNKGNNTIILGNISLANTIGIDYIEISQNVTSEQTKYEAELFEHDNCTTTYGINEASNKSFVTLIDQSSKILLKNANEIFGKAKLTIMYANSHASAIGYIKIGGVKTDIKFFNTYSNAKSRIFSKLELDIPNTGIAPNIEIGGAGIDLDYIELLPAITQIGYNFDNANSGISNMFGQSEFDAKIIGSASLVDSYTGKAMNLINGNILANLTDIGECKNMTIDFDVMINENTDGTLLYLDLNDNDYVKIALKNDRLCYINNQHINNGMLENASFFATPSQNVRTQITLQLNDKETNVFVNRALQKSWTVKRPIKYNLKKLSIGSDINNSNRAKITVDNFYFSNEITSPQTNRKTSKILDVSPNTILVGDYTTVYATQGSDIYVYPATNVVTEKTDLQNLVETKKAIKVFAIRGLNQVCTKGLESGEYYVVAVNDLGISAPEKLKILNDFDNTTVAYKDGKIAVDMSDYMKRHEMISTARAETGRDGMPLGNGVMLANSWNEVSANGDRADATFQLNRTDLFKPNSSMSSGNMPLENLDMGNQPALSKISLTSGAGTETNIKQSLSLYDGILSSQMSISNEKINYSAYINANRDVMTIDYKDQNRKNNTVRKVTANLWKGGNNNTITWKERNANFEFVNDVLYVSEVFTDSNESSGYVLAIKVVGAKVDYSAGYKKGELTIKDTSAGVNYKVYISSILTTDIEAGKKYANKLIEQEMTDNLALAKHKEWWNSIFNKTFLSLGEHDEADYIESLYYMHLYQMACSSRGKNPPSFNGKGWSVNEDEKNWGSYFWNFNIRSLYYSLSSAGQYDLMKPYFKLYSESLHEVMDNTTKSFSSGGDMQQIYPNADIRDDICGAKIPETMNFDGRGVLQNTFVFLLMTTGVDVSMIYWDYYKHTLDKQFLMNELYPLMKEVAAFLMSYSKINSDGYYDLWPINSLEYNQNGEKSTNTLGAFKTILNMLLEIKDLVGAEQQLVDKWTEYSNKMQPMVKDAKGEIFASIVINGETITMENGSWQQPANEIIYPYEMFSKYSEDFDIARATFDRRGLNLPYEWTPEPTQAVRLGLKEETAEMLVTGTKKWQRYPNGMNMETARENTFLSEWLSTVAATSSDMLLMTVNDITTVFPAYPSLRGWDNPKFSLMSRGGFKISSEKNKGIVKYVAIDSLYGSLLKMENPWGGGNSVIVKNTAGEIVYNGKDQIISLQTIKGESYIMERADKSFNTFNFCKVANSKERNSNKVLDIYTIYGYDGRNLDK